MPRIIILAAALTALALSVFAGGDAVAQTPAARVRTPIAAYAALPEIESVSLSDDGAALAYFHRDASGATQAVVQTVAGQALVTVDVSDRRVTRIGWLSPDHVGIWSLVLNSEFYAGTDYMPQLDIVNVRTRGVARALRSADKAVINAVFDSWRGTYRGQPVLYVQAVTTEAHAYTSDIYRVDLDSGRGRRHATGLDDTRGYMLRPDGEVVGRISYFPESGRYRLSSPNGSGGWRTIYEDVSLLDGASIWGYAQDPDKVMVAVTEGDQSFLTEISLSTGERGERSPLPATITGPIYTRDDRLVGMAYEDVTGGQIVFLEPKLEAAWAVLHQGLPGKRLRLVSFSADFDAVVVRTEGSNDAGTYYLYDARGRSVSVVGRSYPNVRPEDIGLVQVVNYTAADGMEQFGYLTTPPGREAKNLPLILFPHGGPASRDHLDFDWWAQAMASRGYAVFQPQFRGSDGFGEAYLRAGYGEWGRKMQTDLSDAVRHLAEEGIIDPARVCIVGASYGGYAALAGVAMEPDVYRCAVSVAGVSDLPAMLTAEARIGGGGPDSRNPVIRYWNRFMGGGRRDDVLAALSPARLASQIQAPVLLIHGRDDTVVPFQQSTLMRQAMERAGKPVVMAPLEGEDHWLSYGPTRRMMLERTIAFLEEHNPPD